MTDTQIIDLFFERSEQAIGALSERHGGAVQRVARNILGNSQDAEECVNDTWLGAWNSIPPARPDPLRAYVCRIARNLATNRYHRNSAQKRNSHYDLALDELSDCVPDSGSVEDALEAKELAAFLNRFLAALPYEDRFLFMRRYWYADPPAEIAKLCGLRAGTVSVRLHRIRERLRKELEKEGLV